MSTGAVLPASIAFIAIPQLKRLEPETAVQALLSLHDVLRRFRTGLLQPPARILSTLTGALLVLPDATDRYLHASLDEIAKDCHARGLAIRVGVTHGDVQELSDVDGTANYIGTPINIAARLATSPENLGCAFHKDFVSHVQAAFIPGARLRPWQYPRVVIKGKPHDAATGFPCTQAPGEAFPVLDAVVAEQLPAITDGVQNINATVLAYDLPHFSAGDANQLSRRFRAVIGAMQQSQVARASSRAFFSPGGTAGSWPSSWTSSSAGTRRTRSPSGSSIASPRRAKGGSRRSGWRAASASTTGRCSSTATRSRSCGRPGGPASSPMRSPVTSTPGGTAAWW